MWAAGPWQHADDAVATLQGKLKHNIARKACNIARKA
jgi:hypothetical protein